MGGSGYNFIYLGEPSTVPEQRTYSRFRKQLYCSSTQVRDSFFRGYGALEFGIEEIAVMESALHIIHSVDLLPFYLREKNMEVFKQTRDRLMVLLEQN